MLQYQSSQHLYDLKGYAIYTTLEPCAMCSGMMIMQKVARTVYGQTDLDFGKAIERLQLDSHANAGYKPYPRSPDIRSEPAQNTFRARIDSAFGSDPSPTNKNVTEWLRSESARSLYKEATEALLNFTVQYPENQPVLLSAKKMYDAVK